MSPCYSGTAEPKGKNTWFLLLGDQTKGILSETKLCPSLSATGAL